MAVALHIFIPGKDYVYSVLHNECIREETRSLLRRIWNVIYLLGKKYSVLAC